MTNQKRGNFGKSSKEKADSKVEPSSENSWDKITSIESDSDFDRYNLYDMEIDKFEKLKDNRRSGFWKLTWT